MFSQYLGVIQTIGTNQIRAITISDRKTGSFSDISLEHKISQGRIYVVIAVIGNLNVFGFSSIDQIFILIILINACGQLQRYFNDLSTSLNRLIYWKDSLWGVLLAVNGRWFIRSSFLNSDPFQLSLGSMLRIPEKRRVGSYLALIFLSRSMFGP